MTEGKKEEVQRIPVDQIKPSPYQPRRNFPPESLKELGESIRQKGVLQPILVRKLDEGFELIAGERRWRASKLIERTEIPAIITEATDEEAAYLALIENIQRENLSELDEAYMYAALVERAGGKVKPVADNLGKSVTYVDDRLSLLKLTEDVQRMFSEGKINLAQAKVLAAIDDPSEQLKMARLAGRLQLSANQLKGRAQHLIKNDSRRPTAASSPRKVSFNKLQATVIQLFDLLENFDPSKYPEEQRQTLEDHFDNLANALVEARNKVSNAVPA